jgi:hypothetical protein
MSAALGAALLASRVPFWRGAHCCDPPIRAVMAASPPASAGRRQAHCIFYPEQTRGIHQAAPNTNNISGDHRVFGHKRPIKHISREQIMKYQKICAQK